MPGLVDAHAVWVVVVWLRRVNGDLYVGALLKQPQNKRPAAGASPTLQHQLCQQDKQDLPVVMCAMVRLVSSTTAGKKKRNLGAPISSAHQPQATPQFTPPKGPKHTQFW